MNKPVFVLVGPQVLVKYRDYQVIRPEVKTFADLVLRIRFLSRFSPLMVFDVKQQDLVRLSTLEFTNPVTVVLQKNTKLVPVQILSKSSKIKQKTTQFKSFSLFNWYLYYLKKGVFSNRLEYNITKLSYSDQIWNEL